MIAWLRRLLEGPVPPEEQELREAEARLRHAQMLNEAAHMGPELSMTEMEEAEDRESDARKRVQIARAAVFARENGIEVER